MAESTPTETVDSKTDETSISDESLYANIDINAMTDDGRKSMFAVDSKIMEEHKTEFDEQSFSDCNQLDFQSIITACPCTKRALIVFKYFHQYNTPYDQVIIYISPTRLVLFESHYIQYNITKN